VFVFALNGHFHILDHFHDTLHGNLNEPLNFDNPVYWNFLLDYPLDFHNFFDCYFNYSFDWYLHDPLYLDRPVHIDDPFRWRLCISIDCIGIP